MPGSEAIPAEQRMDSSSAPEELALSRVSSHQAISIDLADVCNAYAGM